MTGVTGTNSAGVSFAALATNAAPQTPADIAKAMVQKHSDPRGGINFSALKRDLDGLTIRNPELGAAVSKELQAQLGPNNFARMQNASYSIAAADGKGLNISDSAPSLRSYYEGTANQSQGKTAVEKAEIRKSDLAHYARLDRLWGDGNPKTFEEDAINAGISDLIASGQSLDAYEKNRLAAGTAPVAGAQETSGFNGELIADITQMTLDLTGIIDPTPISDGSNVVISLGRGASEIFSGNWSKAGEHGLNGVLSAVGIIPYVGDLGKLGKLGKWAETVTKAVEAAINNPAARKALEPALKKLHDAIGAIPEAAWAKMPDDVKSTLEGIKGKLDELFGAGAKVFSDAVVKTAERLGIPPEKVQAILDTPKGQRPDPSTYMTKEQTAAHLAKFDEGAIRITSRKAFEQWGTVGPTPGFIMPKSEFDALLKSTNGNLVELEKKLGFPSGYLKGDDTMIVMMEKKDLDGLAIPSGNEAGANEFWLPGGTTSGGVAEAIVDLPANLPYKEIKL